MRGPPITGLNVRGVVQLAQRDDTLIIRKWPRKRGPVKTPYGKFAYEEFRQAALMAGTLLPQDRTTCEVLARGTSLTWRDVAMKFILGTTGLVIVMPDGRTIGARRLSNNVQLILDTLGDTPGSLIVRLEDGWTLILPGDDDQVLTMDPDTGVPLWADSQGGGGGGATRYITTPAMTGGSATSDSYNVQGQQFKALENITIHAIVALLDASSGDYFAGYVVELDGVSSTPQITAILDQTTPVTFTDVARPAWRTFACTSPVPLTAGTSYALLIVRTDGSGFSTCSIVQVSNWQPPPMPILSWWTLEERNLTPAVGDFFSTTNSHSTGNGIGADWQYTP